MRWQKTKPRKRRGHAPAAFIDPARPVKAAKAPDGDRWAHEIKHDGFRIQIHTGPNGARIYTFTGEDWTDRFPAIAATAGAIKRTAIMDAEACVAGRDGVTVYELMLTRAGQRRAVAHVFDLMMLDGQELRRQPWIERRALLRQLLGRRRRGIAFNDHVIGNGPKVFEHACRLGYEGIVSKLVDSRYKSGRCPDWVKVKNPAAPGSTRFKE